MGVEQTIAHLIVAAIRRRLESHTLRFGLLARNLPSFDPQVVYEAFAADLAQPTPALRLALVGFSISFHSPASNVTTSVEQAVQWRNDATMTSPLIVLLNPQQVHEKIHSLELLEPFEDTNLRQAIVLEGQRNSNRDHQAIWNVLNSNDLRQVLPLVANQLAHYYVALEEGIPLGEALPRIGLLRDPDLDSFIPDRKGLVRRIKENQEQVQRLLALSSRNYRSLGRALAQNSGQAQRTFIAIQKYRQNPNFDNLNSEALTLIRVKELFAARQSESSIDNNLEDVSISITPSKQSSKEEILFEWMLDPDREYQQIIAELAYDENEAYREDASSDQEPQDEELEPITTVIRDQEITIDTAPRDNDRKHPLEIFMRQWVQDEVWGGLIDARQKVDLTIPVPHLFDSTTILPPLRPFKPLQGSDVIAPNSQPSLIALFTALDAAISTEDDTESFTSALQKLHEKRLQLTPYRKRFLYQPARSAFDPAMFQYIADYIESYERLASRLQKIYRQAFEQYPDTIEQATAQFLALDSIIIVRERGKTRSGEVVLLSTLHPLHLWKWLELARRVQGNTVELSNTERVFLKDKITHLPSLLNTFLLHPAMFPSDIFSSLYHLEEPRLLLAGEIDHAVAASTVGIPYYQATVQQPLISAGFNRKLLQNLFEKFVAFYPPARVGLSLVVINPPALSPIVEACIDLFNRGLLNGARISIYQVNPQTQLNDLRFFENTEVLSLFQNNPRWSISLDLSHTSYASIAEKLSKEGYHHITILFDPSDAIIQPIIRTSQGEPNPFGVPIHVNYDSIRDTTRCIPAPTGGIFDVYIGVRNVLSGELNQRTFGIGGRSTISDAVLDTFMNITSWLGVVDRPNGTFDIPSNGLQLARWHISQRTLTVYTHDSLRWQKHLVNNLKQFSLDINPMLVYEYLEQILTTFPEGLLSIINLPVIDEFEVGHQLLELYALQKLLATIAVLHSYRQNNPATILISLASEDFVQTFDLPDELRRNVAPILAVWTEQEHIYFDVIAIQAHDASLNQLPSLPEVVPILQQLETLAEKLEYIFDPNADKTLLGPIRRELLREHLSMVAFAIPSSKVLDVEQTRLKKSKKEWATTINSLFTAYVPSIRIRAIRVALRGRGQVSIQPYSLASSYNAEIVNLPSIILQHNLQDQAVEQQPLEQQLEIDSSGIFPSTKEPIESKSFTTEQAKESLPPKEVILPVDTNEWLEISQQADRVLQVLVDYGIAIAGIDKDKTEVGPRIVRYWVKLQPPMGRLTEVQKYAVDLARELGSKTVPLIDNIPGEKYIGIDLARTRPRPVPLAPALAYLSVEQTHTLFIAMGVNAAGQRIQEDLVKMPHMLVAGSTGSGKTIFLNTLITSLAKYHAPSDLSLMLVDPKQTDFVVFDRLPHLYSNRIFYEPADAIEALRTIINIELEHRTSLLSQARCPNNLEYNRRNPTHRIPWLVIVVDEFADIMLTLNRRDREMFERQIVRLAGIGRSKGIHLVLATQRPTTDIITGNLKTNIPVRVSFRLPSLTDSRTILDRGGAEHLLGQGDMLLSLNGEIQRLQSYYASFQDIEQILNDIVP